MASLNKCIDALQAIGVTSKAGRTVQETASALCLASKKDKGYDDSVGITPTLIGKMLSTRWSRLNKSVDGGITHFLSVDNGAAYAELWSQGENWYAVTGADDSKKDKAQRGGFWMVPGIIKGMSAPEAVPHFLKALETGDFSGGKAKKGCNC